MHLGRFNYVTWIARNYFESNSLLETLDQAIAQLQAYISTPTAESSKAFRSKVDFLLEACAKTPTGYNAASFKHIIADTGGEKYFGSGLELSLREIIEKLSMTPADMLGSLQKFRKSFAAYITSITTISDELSELGVEYEELESDQFEFGAMFPKELIGKSIIDIQGELEHLDRLFKTLNELMGNGSTSPIVRNISSSWWQFFIELSYEQVAAITFSIERIVALYKSNLEIQKLKRDAEKNELGADLATLIEQKIDAKLRSGMVEIAEKVRLQFQKNADNARCNELEIQLRMELAHIAKRINQGAAYEIRAGIPNKPKKLAEEEKDDQKAILKHDEAMQEFERKNTIAQEVNSVGLRLADAIEEISGETQLLTDYAKLTEGLKDKPTDAKAKK